VSGEFTSAGLGQTEEGQDGEPVGNRADHHRPTQAPAIGEESDQGGEQRPEAPTGVVGEELAR